MVLTVISSDGGGNLGGTGSQRLQVTRREAEGSILFPEGGLFLPGTPRALLPWPSLPASPTSQAGVSSLPAF